MTSLEEWNPSLLNDSKNASKLQLKQFPPTPIDTAADYFNMEGNIIVQKSEIDDNAIISEFSSTSSGSTRQSFQLITRKEKQKK